MLELLIDGGELFDEVSGEFISSKPTILNLEHSLLSVRKWEAKWHIPFFSDKPKTKAQSIDYIRCMTINRDVNPIVYTQLTNAHFSKINEYMEDPMTATWFKKDPNEKKGSSEIITSEILYWQMIMYNIPPEYQKWHLNQLITLIRVCAEKSKPQKKMSRKDQMAQQRALNAARLKKHKTRG